jgi:uncharacterized protein
MSNSLEQPVIPVRKLKLETIPADEFDPICVAGNAAISYNLWGVSLYVTFLEPFIVKTMRRVMDNISNDGLKDSVDRFSRQEAQHYQQHQRFNEPLFEQGYPGLEERYQQLKQDFEQMLENRTDKYCVGFVEGFEAYTTQGALRVFESRLLQHPKTNKRVADIFTWHLMEEIEHRTIAYDIYQDLFGSYAYRAYMCLVAQNHITAFTNDIAGIMSRFDRQRFGDRCHVTLPVKLLTKVARLALTSKSILPGYNPHKYVIPPSIQAISDHYSDIAVEVT